MSPRTKGDAIGIKSMGSVLLLRRGVFLSRVKHNDSCLIFLLEGPNAVLFWKDGRGGNDNV